MARVLRWSETTGRSRDRVHVTNSSRSPLWWSICSSIGLATSNSPVSRSLRSLNSQPPVAGQRFDAGAAPPGWLLMPDPITPGTPAPLAAPLIELLGTSITRLGNHPCAGWTPAAQSPGATRSAGPHPAGVNEFSQMRKAQLDVWTCRPRSKRPRRRSGRSATVPDWPRSRRARSPAGR